MKLFATFGLLLITTYLWVVPVPQENHPTICLPTHHENNEPCMCLSMKNGEMNCKEGKLVTETQMCKSFCEKDKCMCCAYMDSLKKPKGQK